MSKPDTNQASEDEIAIIEKIIKFNCPMGCDGNGSYPEVSADGEWEQGQCQWCFEYGMPARDAIQSIIRTEKLKLLAEVREQAGEYELNMHGFYDKDVSDQITAVPLEELTKLEAEL